MNAVRFDATLRHLNLGIGLFSLVRPGSSSLAMTFLLLASSVCAVHAQAPSSASASAPDSATGADRRGAPSLVARRLSGPAPRLDGVLDDEAWRAAEVATAFTQFSPDPGAPASFETEARVLFADDALFVAIQAFDPSPDSIVGQLTRRDQNSYSDVVGVMVDSYDDQRTAFHFDVNAAGVQRDIYRFDDTSEDIGWDAVWGSAVARNERGWAAEFRIPFSQLRFRDGETQRWGINFYRQIARRDEMSAWSPTSQNEAAIVSRFGVLEGLEGIDPPRRLEILPYTVARVERAPGNPSNPYYERNDLFGSLGGDVRFGVTNDLTLTLTLNPDFGQVEADPAQVNLSAFEVFLPERRPFFVEGLNFFRVGLEPGGEGNESLFYSRRIGRAPQGRVDAQGGWSDQDEQTTILGAWKLSGKTASGWSVGLMHAVTAEEMARITPSAGPERQQEVEPFTNYSVARFQRDFRAGRSALGLVATGVNRSADVAGDLALPTGGYTFGVDGRHRFAEDRWQAAGYVIGSHVRGQSEAILRLQQSATHLFQRPDAEHLTLDPTRTSLSGLTWNAELQKLSGGNLRFAIGTQGRSPGFDANDAGFQREADYAGAFGYVGWDQAAPMGFFRRWRLNANASSAWSWGGEHYQINANINGNAQFSNLYTAFAGLNYNGPGLSNSALRGGPALRKEASWSWWAGLGSDPRPALSARLNASGSVRPEGRSHSLGLSPTILWRPSGRLNLDLGPVWVWNVDDRQWVSRVGTNEAPNWIMGRLDQQTVGLTGRFNFAFSPTLSLQIYAQPFVSAGRYLDFKRVSDPGADRYADRFTHAPHVQEDGRVLADLDGDGQQESLATPDFNVRQFRSNTVLRWEYRPGSALFVVWAQGRDDFSSVGDFDFRSDLGAVFGTAPRNIFLVKFSYWIGS